MNAILLLLAASLSLGLLFLGAFIWSVRRGQFDDDVTPAMRILTEEDEPCTEAKASAHHLTKEPT